MAVTREVVITGVGVISPIGIGTDAFGNSLRTGHSGVAALNRLRGTSAPVRFGAEIKDFDAKLFVTPRKSLKVMCREMQTGFSAALLAVQDAGLVAGSVDPDRFGVVFASDMLYGTVEDLEVAAHHCVVEGRFEPGLWGQRAMSDIYPLWLLKHLPNMSACHLAIAHDARGPNNTIGLGEASSLLALIESVCVIQRGHADVMITGGSGSRLNITPMLHRGDSNLSHRNDDPAAASRPFDALRDGMVNGEGAGTFILESRRHAEMRGARIRARVLGFGTSCETSTDRSPGSRRAYHRAIAAALRSASLDPAEIGHVNAHGVSTTEDDAVEAQAIRDCLGNVPVTAPKSFFGNLGAGGGAVEMAASILAFDAGEIPVTLNYEHPDPQCPVNVIHGEPLRQRQPRAMILSHSGTGQVAAVALAGP